MSTLTASRDRFVKLLNSIPDLGEEAVKQTWKMVTHTRKFTGDQKKRLVSALQNNKHVKRRESMMAESLRKSSIGGKSRGRKSCGRKSRGRTKRGGSSCGSTSRRSKTMRRGHKNRRR